LDFDSVLGLIWYIARCQWFRNEA